MGRKRKLKKGKNTGTPPKKAKIKVTESFESALQTLQQLEKKKDDAINKLKSKQSKALQALSKRHDSKISAMKKRLTPILEEKHLCSECYQECNRTCSECGECICEECIDETEQCHGRLTDYECTSIFCRKCLQSDTVFNANLQECCGYLWCKSDGCLSAHQRCGCIYLH